MQFSLPMVGLFIVAGGVAGMVGGYYLFKLKFKKVIMVPVKEAMHEVLGTYDIAKKAVPKSGRSGR